MVQLAVEDRVGNGQERSRSWKGVGAKEMMLLVSAFD
jgi:hypothetical protein